MKVIVAIHDHRYGITIRAFDSWAKADAWRERLARDGWDSLGLGDDPFDVGTYWDTVPEEWFSSEEMEVE